jgi:hypothetical protein
MYFVPEAQTVAFDEPSLQAREVWSHFPYSIVIWAPGNPPDLEKQVTKTLTDFDIPMYEVHSYSDVIHADYAQQNLLASLTWLFGTLGSVLAAVGLYGVTGYGVEERTSEIGVRVALGADRGQVLMMVLRGALWPVGIGVARDSGGDRNRPADRNATVQRQAMGSSNPVRGDGAPWAGRSDCWDDSRTSGDESRPDGRAEARVNKS